MKIIFRIKLFKWSCNVEMDNAHRLEFEKNFKSALDGISLSFTSPATKFMPWSRIKRRCTEGARLTRITAKSVVEMRQKDMDSGKKIPEDALSYVFKMKETLPDCDIEDLVDMMITVVFGGNVIFMFTRICFFSLCVRIDIYWRIKSL